MACSFGSLKTEAGIKELNEHLASRSFVAGGTQATQEDFECFQQVSFTADMEAFPHARRWVKQLRALKTAFPLRQWPKAGASQGADKQGGSTKGKDQARLEGLLANAEDGKVCTRFPPEPSGYLHIGHAKAAMLNNHYARHYNGKLILRFDDTNPSKEKMEFEESIVKDLATLEVYPDMRSHTSDYFDHLQKIMEDVIKSGKAYVDDTDVDTMRAQRDKGVASTRRDQSLDENMKMWKEMLKGTETGLKCCVRGKMDMQSPNKCLRDPVFYRCKTDVPHHIHGNKYKAYPTYDFACPVVDALEGVTHALRTIEYKDRAEMYHWVLEATGSRKVELVEFSKTQFSHTILSKRKLTWFVDNGYVEGWNDPRFPTVQGVLRRGMTVDGLKEFVLTQGMSKATVLMEWDKIWAINKQKIDPVVPRYAAVAEAGAVHLQLDGPAEPVGKMDKKHPKNDELGERLILQCKDVWVEQEDAQAIEQGEQVTLLHWGNAIIEKVERNGAGEVVSMTGRLNLEGSVKDTKKKIHWVPKLEDRVTPLVLRELDHLVTKPKIEDDDDIKDIINPCSIMDTVAIGDPLLKTLSKGEKMQLERRGYFIVDTPAFPPGKPMVLVKIPDGKGKDMAMKSKVDPSKLQGAAAKPADGAKASASAAAPKAEPAAKDAKAEAKAKAKAKGKAAGGKPADRPIDDITRLDIRVGRIQKVWPHAEAEKLYCEEIDLGEASGPRTIASGLRAHLKEEEMKDQLVIVLANLKPRKLVGFDSQGMVLCATSSSGKVELMQPPAGAKVGERVTIEGVEMADADEKLNEKTGKAPWEALKDGCRTTASMEGSYKGARWMTSAGPVACKTVADGQIS